MTTTSSYILHALLIISLLVGAVGCGESDQNSGDDVEQIDSAVHGSETPGDGGTDSVDLSSTLPVPAIAEPLPLVPRVVRLKEANHLVKETEFILNVPDGYEITPVADGMKRVRFMAFSPDSRLFVTDMKDLSDNSRGKIYALEEFDPSTRRFLKRTTWLDGLRNPNNIAFHTDRAGTTWLYTALTDRLVRYRYQPGSTGPDGTGETLATFPDSGKSYREGGWHLTRTVTFGDDGKLYVSVGSSCNVCVEKEEVRATILQMNPDGSDQLVYARGLRNAVGIRYVEGSGLYATNMGADHLGLDRPEDNFYRVEEGGDYGWPWAYEYERVIYPDPSFGTEAGATPVDQVKPSLVGFPAHASPLGFDWFGSTATSALQNTFLVALHGSGAVSMARGYSIVRVGNGELIGDFVNGFLVGKKRYGRPCDVLHLGDESFLFSDDYAGVVYLVYRSGVVGLR